jgi:molybdate transport system substrate-binding protein
MPFPPRTVSGSRSRRRTGRINPLFALLLAAGALIVLLLALLQKTEPASSDPGKTLVMYTAAGLRPPVEQVVADYKKEYGVTVELQFGGSNSLLNQLKVDKFSTADLYLAADQFYLDQAQEEGLAAEILPIGEQFPVIAVPKGNPLGITSIDDLLKGDVGVVVANPEQAAVGRAVADALQAIPSGEQTMWDRLEKHVTDHGVFKPTVNDVANDVKIGSVDAGIVWNTTVASPKYREALDAIVVPELEAKTNQVGVTVLKSSQQPTAALHFARYLTARDRGLPKFEEFALRTVDGDVWADRPEITFFCGAVNRRSIADALETFQEREGVAVNTVYDGCGILTSRMRGIEGQKQDLGFPDVYMACDRYYLENVRDWFQEDVDVSDAEIVIAVPKGSDKVKGLADLIKPGVRVAIGQPEQCTIGALTRRLLQEQGLYDKLMAKQQQEGEVVVNKSSSALLVPDVVTGSVDAAIAYITDVQSHRNDVDVLHINSTHNLAIQPFSVAKGSDHKYLVRRLFAAISASPAPFEQAGFHYRLDKPSPAPSADSAGESKDSL